MSDPLKITSMHPGRVCPLARSAQRLRDVGKSARADAPSYGPPGCIRIHLCAVLTMFAAEALASQLLKFCAVDFSGGELDEGVPISEAVVAECVCELCLEVQGVCARHWRGWREAGVDVQWGGEKRQRTLLE